MPPSARGQPSINTPPARYPWGTGQLWGPGCSSPSRGRGRKPSFQVPSGANEPLRPPFPKPFLHSSLNPATQQKATHLNTQSSNFGGAVHGHFLARVSYGEARLIPALLLCPNSLHGVRSVYGDVHTHTNNLITSVSDRCFNLFRTQISRMCMTTLTGNRLILLTWH